MAEYIERQKVREAIRVDGYEHFSGLLSSSEVNLLEMVDEVLCQMPAADVAPVVHGRWIEQEDGWGGTYYDCSACGESWTTIDGTPMENNMNFCPNCGAKMDLEE